MIKIFYKRGIIQISLLIVLIYILFIIYIIYNNISSDLISDHYYEEEIKYQKIINNKKNVKKLKTNIILKLKKNGIILIFPTPFNYKNIFGKLSLIRFSDKKKDIHQIIKLNKKNEYFISSKELKHGLYQLQLKWSYNNYIDYFIEKKIIWKN